MQREPFWRWVKNEKRRFRNRRVSSTGILILEFAQGTWLGGLCVGFEMETNGWSVS
jgi:hypothetical protein